MGYWPLNVQKLPADHDKKIWKKYGRRVDAPTYLYVLFALIFISVIVLALCLAQS